MSDTSTNFSFMPSASALAEFGREWSWLLPDPIVVITASLLGDLFFQQGGIRFTGLTPAPPKCAKSLRPREAFLALLETEEAENWFLPGLIENLRAAGKRLKYDGCYTYVTLPIFREGKYTVDNLNPVPAWEHFGVTGSIHRQIKDLPDGATLQIKVG